MNDPRGYSSFIPKGEITMNINAVCWLTLLASFGVVMPTFIMLRVVNPLLIVIVVVSAIVFVIGNLAIAHHNAQTA
jgi:hypothetical protein